MEEGIISAVGYNGSVSFDGRIVTISHRGFLSGKGQGDRRIPVTAILSVHFKPPTRWLNGFIEFTVPGANRQNPASISRTLDAARSDTSVMFRAEDLAAFARLRDAVEDVILNAAPGPQADSAQGSPPPPPAVPAGWYPDPNNAQLQRYWDGGSWTDHTAPLPQQP